MLVVRRLPQLQNRMISLFSLDGAPIVLVVEHVLGRRVVSLDLI